MSMKTEFEGVCPTPGPNGTHEGLSGGYPIADVGPGGPGLMNSPWTEGLCSPPSGKETSSSELGTTPTLTNVKDAPSGMPTVSGIGIVTDHQADQTFKANQ